MEAEKACTKALGQHRSSKGYFRRARARRMMGREDEAMKDLRAILKLQPTNVDAIAELSSLASPSPTAVPLTQLPSSSSSKYKEAPAPLSYEHDRLHILRPKPPKQLPFARTKADDRKLKIVLLPMTVDTPVHYSCKAAVAPLPSSANEKQKWEVNELTKGASNVKMEPETFTYPSWDRYVVRRD